MKYIFFSLILIFSYSCKEKKIENPLNHEEFSEPIPTEGRLSELKNGRYGIADKKGIIRTKFNYPNDEIKYSNRKKSAAYKTKLILNPDKKRVVSTATVGGILEILSVDNRGVKKIRIKPNFYKLSTGKHVLIYNWKGEPKTHFKLNLDVEYICVNDKETELFAIHYTPEPKIVKFNLKQ
ncbi:MAG: hypothetical protein R6U04_04640 [Bacteroidales bacterium]